MSDILCGYMIAFLFMNISKVVRLILMKDYRNWGVH